MKIEINGSQISFAEKVIDLIGYLENLSKAEKNILSWIAINHKKGDVRIGNDEITEISRRYYLTSNTVSNAVNKLHSRGCIVRIGKGWYNVDEKYRIDVKKPLLIEICYGSQYNDLTITEYDG